MKSYPKLMTKVTLISSKDALSFNDNPCIFISIYTCNSKAYAKLSLSLIILLICDFEEKGYNNYASN